MWHCPLLRALQFIMLRRRHRQPHRAYLSSLNYQATHPLTHRATGCSKLLFLWEMIKEMLPYVQILNCLVHELRSRAAALQRVQPQ